jgi:hypothetical protein
MISRRPVLLVFVGAPDNSQRRAAKRLSPPSLASSPDSPNHSHPTPQTNEGPDTQTGPHHAARDSSLNVLSSHEQARINKCRPKKEQNKVEHSLPRTMRTVRLSSPPDRTNHRGSSAASFPRLRVPPRNRQRTFLIDTFDWLKIQPHKYPFHPAFSPLEAVFRR